MNFYNLKLKFKEFLIDQGISSTKINQEKDLDNINLFTFGSEFQKFIDKEYEINLENEYTELAEIFDKDLQDGKFVLGEDKANDKEANFMLDMVNGLLEDEEFVENIDEYSANDNQENSMLDMLNDLFKEKGITQDSSSEQNSDGQEVSDIPSTEVADAQSTDSSSSSTSDAATSSAPSSSAPTYNSNNNIFTPPTQTTKDYSDMNREELEEAKSSQETKISEESQNLDDTIVKNQDNVEKAKEEYDAAMEEDNVDPALLESRNQNLEAITQTDNTINELTATISDLDSQISDVESEISSVESSISSLNSALSSLSSAPSDDEEAQAEVEAKRAEISAQISELESKKQDLETKKTDLESQKTENETSLTENTSLLQQLETEKTNIETQILETCNENTKMALENYNQARTDATTALQNAKEKVTTANNELREINTHLDKIKSRELENKYSYRGKADAFIDNEGFLEPIPGDPSTNLDYNILVPKNLDPNKPAPVMVYLHGSGGNKNSLYNQNLKDYNLASTFNGYIICPSAKGTWNNETAAQNIDQILNTFAQTHKVDKDNIVIVGHSMGGTGALYMADSEVFKDDEGFKFSKAAAITGYPDKKNDYDIPVALYADSGSESALKDHILNKDSNDKYVDWVGELHGNMDYRAFTEDLDNDGKADMLEWLFDND